MDERDTDHLSDDTTITRLRRAAEHELDLLPDSSPLRDWLADEVDDLAEEESTAAGGRPSGGRGDGPPGDD
jgi:hypothetical protein